MFSQDLTSSPTVVEIKSLLQMRGYTRHINLKSIKKTASFISGLHDSKFSGRGMDYQESRNYQAGDDIRNMDWRVTARTGTAHTKLYQEERERPVYLLVDTNQSMYFGTRCQFKSVLAAKIAALFAWATTKQGDRIGIMCFGVKGIHSKKPRAGQKATLTTLAHLIDNSPQSPESTSENSSHIASNLDDCLKQLRTVIRPGSLVIIISDFYHLGPYCKRHLTQLSKHNDVIGVLVSDPFEQHTPLPSLYGVVSSKGQQMIDTHKKDVTTQIAKNREQHLQSILDDVIKAGVSLIPVETNGDMLASLKKGLEQPSQQLKNWINQFQS